MWYHILEGLICVALGAIVGGLVVFFYAMHFVGKGVMEVARSFWNR